MADKVIVITINYNQTKYTLDCIDSILKSDYSEYLILLIDNVVNEDNSKDLEINLPIDERIIFRRLYPNRGYVGGVNYALTVGADLGAEFFLIMNNDTIIDRQAIKELVNCCKYYKNMAIVTGKVLDYNQPEMIQQLGSTFYNLKYLLYKPVGINEIDVDQYNFEQSRDMIDDVFWLFPYALYKRLGGYSEFFWFNSEQADYALRAKKEGYKLLYTPNAKIWHKGSPSLGGRDYNPAHVYWNVQSSLLLRFLHLPANSFILYYLRTVQSITATYLKAIFLIFQNVNRFRYAHAKLSGWMYFNHWLITKDKNYGINPFIEKNKD